MNHPKANSLINETLYQIIYSAWRFREESQKVRMHNAPEEFMDLKRHPDQRRVMAINAIGQYDPLPLIKSFIARNERDVLEASGRPEAYDWNRIFFDLNWNLKKK